MKSRMSSWASFFTLGGMSPSTCRVGAGGSKAESRRLLWGWGHGGLTWAVQGPGFTPAFLSGAVGQVQAWLRLHSVTTTSTLHLRLFMWKWGSVAPAP